jgi:alpha-N-arabinofuranosidase
MTPGLFAPSLLAAILLATAGQAGSAGLQNPGFEADRPLEGWQLVAYGASAACTLDDREAHEGKRSLRVEADEPSDTALGQEIDLQPGRWYRFTGWVKTRSLQPVDATVTGTFQVQRAGGRGVLAGGPSHRGDVDWTPVVLTFHVPAEGRVRIAPFLAGYGKGRGTAWFDGMALEPIDPESTPAVITRTPLSTSPISPLQYGQFIEYLCTLVPGMWAEKLADGSFEGLTPYKMAYLKETDFRERPWYPSGATNRASFERDGTTRVNGEASYRIAVTGQEPCTVGIAQDGLAIQQGVACTFSCSFKAAGIRGPIRLRLHREGREYANATLAFPADDAWHKLRAVLTPSGTDDRATLTIDFRGPGTLWLDGASLMPEDAVGGWRKDVVQAVRAMRPGVIRFGGSALDDPNLGDFEWRDTIGDLDHRKPFRAWGGLQPVGAGLEEIVQFCRLVDAEPLLCVRIRNRTPQDAAEQVAYFNAPANTPMGALRARNGHPEPYRVRYWQVGNEQAGPDYEARLPEFCRAMKQADPTIQLLASYPTPGVLRRAGAWLDFVSPHHYDCANLAGVSADLEAIGRLIRSEAPGRAIRVAVTEWNTTAGDWGPRRARLWTLENALACARYHNALHRHADQVAIACRSNLTNSFCSGCIQTDSHRLYVSPAYHAQWLYATLAGSRPLRIEGALPADAAPDLSATLTDRGDAVILFAVNDGPDALSRSLDYSAFGNRGQDLTIWTLGDTKQAGELDAANSFGEPERVSPRGSTFRAASPRFVYSFPPWSLSVLRWQVERGTGEPRQ